MPLALPLANSERAGRASSFSTQDRGGEWGRIYADQGRGRGVLPAQLTALQWQLLLLRLLLQQLRLGLLPQGDRQWFRVPESCSWYPIHSLLLPGAGLCLLWRGRGEHHSNPSQLGMDLCPPDSSRQVAQGCLCCSKYS